MRQSGLAGTILAVVLAGVTLVSCGPRSETVAAAPTGPTADASDPVADLARYGRAILNDTPGHMKNFVRADMSCSACHLQNGTKARGGSLVGVYARFPQYSQRAHRVIALQDRIAECFLYSMNGRVPPYQSKEMIAIVAYLATLSRGTPVGTPQQAADGFDKFSPPSPPDAHRGAPLYAQKCSACHQANGGGISGTFPPLWGPRSFNDGAGMHRIATMASFVRHNMPLGSPNTLTAQQAYDISAFVLSHNRPAFDKHFEVVFPPQRADFF